MRLVRWTRWCVMGAGLLVGLGCSDNYGGGSGCTSAAFPDVNIQNTRFCPTSRTITVGTRVVWRNLDGFNHTSTSDVSSAEVWHSGNILPSGSFFYDFNTPGTFTYHCNIHSSMTGTITVN